MDVRPDGEMAMAQISITKRIAAPVERVFDVATDFTRAAEHIRGIEKIELLTNGPIGVGTRWCETRKVMGSQSTDTLEIVGFDRPRSYSVGSESCGAYFESTFRFTSDGTGTLLTLDVRTEARSLLAKLMSPLSNLMCGKMMSEMLQDDLNDIQRVAELRGMLRLESSASSGFVTTVTNKWSKFASFPPLARSTIITFEDALCATVCFRGRTGFDRVDEAASGVSWLISWPR